MAGILITAFSYVSINKYWDRVSKIIICLVDAALNWYFIHVVDARLVKHHGLRKYKPLIGYYTKLGILSICMDVSQTTAYRRVQKFTYWASKLPSLTKGWVGLGDCRGLNNLER